MAQDSSLGRRRPEGNTVFVGRNEELATLLLLLEEAGARRASLALIAGEPGIGKTALCECLAMAAAERGYTTLVGHCYEEASQSLPYLPFLEAFRSYVSQCDPRRLRVELGAGAPDIARIVPEVRERLTVEPGPAFGTAEDRWRLLQSVTGFLREVARTRPLLLVLEDLHWADSGTLDLLVHLARHLEDARLLIVCTYRDIEVNRAHPLAAALAEIRRVGSLPRLGLAGLTIDDVRRLLQLQLGRDIPLTLAEQVHRRTEGNPLFVQEVLHSVQRDAELDSDWPLSQSVPQGLRETIGSRLAKLSTGCGQVLTLAAVVGREFTLDTLRRVTSLDDESLIAAIEEAERAAIIEDQSRASLIRYRFAHALFQEALNEELSAPRRLRLHRQVARALEEQYATRLDEHAAELAEHLSYSGDPGELARAVRYYRIAADRAVSVFAYGEAVRLLDRAIEVQDRLDTADKAARCDLLISLGEALEAAGQPQRALAEVLPLALALAEAVGDRARAFAACRVAVQSSGVPVSANRYWQDSGERHVGDDPRDRIKLNLPKATRALHEGRFAETRALLLEAIALAGRGGDREAEIGSMSFALRVGVLSAEEEKLLFADLVGRPRSGRSTVALTFLHFDALMSYLQWGDRVRAEAERRDLADLAGRTRYPQTVDHAATAEALFASLDGHLRQADGHLRQAMETSSATHGRFTFTHFWRGRIASWLGDESTLETELAWCDSIGSYYAPAFKAALLAHAGRFEEAREVARGALSRFAEKSSAETMAFSFSTLLFEAAVLSGDETATAELLTLLRGDPRRLAKPNFILLPRLEAKAAALLGKRQEARACFREATEFCEGILYRPERALVRVDLAQLLLDHFPGERAEAMKHLELAIAELEDMQMAPALAQARALQERLATGPTPRPSYPDGLSAREVEVLRLIATGKTNQQIADELVISLNTVLHHVSNILAKTSAANRGEAAAYAHRHGIAD